MAVEHLLRSDPFTIATWNVNSIKVRSNAVIDWLKQGHCDILLMQELKSMDENFPLEAFHDAGFEVHVHGQKTYNGVAIASRLPLTLRQKGLPLLDTKTQDSQAEDSQTQNSQAKDIQARYIEVEHEQFIIGCLYLPNGNPVMKDGNLSEKFSYKLNWMDRLNHHAAALNRLNRPVVLAGDYNIIPEAGDCYDITAWQGDALHHPETLKKWRQLNYHGYLEAWRALHPSQIAYSFWDYQGGAWQKDHGIRIDHFMLNAEAADRLIAADIDKAPRGLERASDHTPVWCQLAHDVPVYD